MGLILRKRVDPLYKGVENFRKAKIFTFSYLDNCLIEILSYYLLKKFLEIN